MSLILNLILHRSLGLFKTPRLRYLEKQSQQTAEKTKGKGKGASDESSDSEESDDSDESDSDESDSDKSDHEKNNSDHSDSGDSGNGLFTVKSSGTLERLQVCTADRLCWWKCAFGFTSFWSTGFVALSWLYPLSQHDDCHQFWSARLSFCCVLIF